MNTGTHPVAPEEVMAFLDGELVPEKVQAVSTHIHECAECCDLATLLGSTSRSLSEWKAGTVESSLQKRVMETLANRQPVSSHSSTWIGRFQIAFSRPLPWALACLVLALLIGARLISFRLAPSSAPFAKSQEYRSVLLTNPPSPGMTYGHGSAADKATGGRGAKDGYDFFVDGVSPNAGAQGSHEKLEQKATPNATASTIVDRRSVENMPQNGRSFNTLLQLTPGVVTPGPMIARTVSLSIVVKDFDAGRSSLDAILRRHNGYAASLNVSTPQGAARVIEASLRIPAPQLAAAIDEVKALGRVENETQNGEEVTQQHADLVARLKNSRETEQRLQEVLRTRTGKVKDVLEVEEEIARVRGEIEEMEAEQKTLEHRVDFATIELKLAEEYKAQLNTPAPSVFMQLRNASVNGFRNAFESLLALVLFLVESGPSLLLWLALLGIPAWRLWKRYRRAQSFGSLAGA